MQHCPPAAMLARSAAPASVLTQHLKPRLLHHVCAHDGSQAMRPHPRPRHVQAKHVRHAPRVGAPAVHVWAGVGPQQVAQQALAGRAQVLAGGAAPQSEGAAQGTGACMRPRSPCLLTTGRAMALMSRGCRR